MIVPEYPEQSPRVHRFSIEQYDTPDGPLTTYWRRDTPDQVPREMDEAEIAASEALVSEHADEYMRQADDNIVLKAGSLVIAMVNDNDGYVGAVLRGKEETDGTRTWLHIEHPLGYLAEVAAIEAGEYDFLIDPRNDTE